MFERIADLPPGIDGVKAIGRITKSDYEKSIAPIFEEARRKNDSVRFLYELGPDFEGFSAGAAWEDARFGLSAIRALAGCAVVTNTAWIREAAKFVGFWLPCPLRVYPLSERGQAVEYLRSLPEKPGVSQRLLPEAGVIVVEIREALRAQDFDALAATADQWILARGSLNGVVLRAHHFPGWENLSGLLKHVRFVRDHHRKIKRIAIASNAKLASLTPELAEHFVEAEIQTFGFDEVDDAIAWCAKAPASDPGA